MECWDAEIRTQSVPVSRRRRRPLNKIALNYETTTYAAVVYPRTMPPHDLPYISFSLFSFYSRGYIRTPRYIIHEVHPCICPAIYLVYLTHRPSISLTSLFISLSLSRARKFYETITCFQRVLLNLILLGPFNYAKYRRGHSPISTCIRIKYK